MFKHKLICAAAVPAGPILLGADNTAGWMGWSTHRVTADCKPWIVCKHKLTCAAAVSAGPVLLGAESAAGRMAWFALGEHLGLQPSQLHQHCAVQA